MADKEKKSEKKPLVITKVPGKTKLKLFLLSIALIAFIRLGFVFFVIGMLPTIVAYYMDISKQRYTYRSIFAANVSGILPYIVRIAHEGHSSAVIQAVMGSAATWITVYGASLIGWVLVLVCPMIAQSMVMSMHQAQLARFGKLQQKLESEWGQEVTQFSGENAQHH